MRRLIASLCLPVSALALAACGATSTTSTAGFSGAKGEVAHTIADLQSNASSAEPKKICADDLAGAVVAKLGGPSGCEAAIKRQLDQVDDLELTIESIRIAAGGRAASATVKSVHEGKLRSSAVLLAKEAGKWKITGLGS